MLPSSTKYLKLLGSYEKDEFFHFPERKRYIKYYAQALQEKYNIAKDIAKNLVSTYGERAYDVLNMIHKRKDLMERLDSNHPFLKGEVLYQIKCEMAQSPIDIVVRRTRLGTLDKKAGLEALPKIVDIFGEVNSWSTSKKKQVFSQCFDEFIRMDF